MAPKPRHEWPAVINAVRTCREVAGNTAPTRHAVEQLLGGGDATRINVGIRAVDAEYGFHPEFLDTLSPEVRALVTDPRKPGGRLAVPPVMAATLPEPYLAALITITGAITQTLEDGATNAAVLVDDFRKRADERVATAEAAVAYHVKTIRARDKELASLREQLATAKRRADRAEAACTAYKNGKRAVAGLEAKVDDLAEAVKTRGTTATTAATKKRAALAR